MTKVVDGIGEEPTRYIIQNMREIDRKEIFACRGDKDPEHLLFDTMWAANEPGMAFTYFADDGEPVSVMGWRQTWPNVANVWAFGTDRWPEAVKTMTKVVRRVIVPALVEGGYHRAECAALTERADTAKWLPMLGMKREAVLAGFGSQREDFTLYVWRPEHVHKQQQRRQEGSQVAEAASC